MYVPLFPFAAKFNSALASGDKDATASALHVAVKEFDRAAEKGIIHKNNAANKKSKMMRKLNGLGS